MRGTIVARRYARALLLVAEERGNMAEVGEHLQVLSEAVAADASIETFLGNPLVPAARKRDVLLAALEAQGAPDTLAAFVKVLCEARRATLLSPVSSLFSEMADTARNILAVRLSSASRIEEDALQRVRAKIEQKTGKSVRLETGIDPELIGGVSVRIGNTLLDGSLRSRLDQARQALR